MSKLGNIKESYGKQIGIAVANTDGKNILASTLLPKNSIIIASPVDADANDVGTYAMFITDNDGTPVRLTYVIEPGNGLNIDEENTDIIKLNIDNRSIQTNYNGELFVGLNSIIDNSTIVVNNGMLSVNTNNIPTATTTELGVVGLDEETIKVNQTGQIYVETDNLDRANNSQIGIVQSDNKTIDIDSNGVISVNTDQLNYATLYEPGIVQYDGKTIRKTESSQLKVHTSSLNYATADDYGISKCDGSTIVSRNGIYSVNTNSLQKSSPQQYGVVKSDDVSVISDNGILSVNKYDNIISTINIISEKISEITKEVNRLSSLTDSAVTRITDPTIFTFICNSVTSANLTKAKYGTFPEDMLNETITAEFTVNTNCPFVITITYLDNLAPTIYLYEINYDDINNYPGEIGLYNEFQSTDYTDKILRFSWKCKNYAASTGGESKPTRIKITISYTKDNTVSQTVYYNIVRYNSLFKKEKLGPTILTADTSGKLSIDNSITINTNSKKRIKK